MENRFKFVALALVAAGLLGIAVTARADTGYFRQLSDRDVTYLSDGCYSVCLLLGVADKYGDFKSQRFFLEKNGILPQRLYKAEANEVLRKGVAAYMFCKALDIKGGVIMHVFGVKEKYALRELVFKKLVDEGPEQGIVTGKELLSILMRASEYKAERGKR